MAKYTGYVDIPHATYDEWRNATLGNGYDIDGYYGCQCLTAGHFVAMQDGSYKDVKDIKEGEIVSTGNRVIINKKRLTTVYKVYTKIGNFKVSSDHRFILKDGQECYLKKILHKELNLDVTENKKIYNLTNNELRFLGFYLGDGTKKYRYKNSTVPQIIITIGTQEKEDYLLSLGFNYHVNLHSNQKAKIFNLINKEHPNLVKLINNLDEKNLPRFFTADQYKFIIEGYLKADGYKKRSQYICSSINKGLLLSIQYGCFLNGWQAKISDPLIRKETNLCKHPNPIYRLSINFKRQPNTKVTKIECIGDEYVYLLNLDGTHLYFADNVEHHNCWDFASEFWRNVGFPQGYPLISASSIYTMWTQYRWNNAAYNGTTYFTLITNLNDVKRGDFIVYNQFSANPYGHGGFADQDYDTWHAANPSSYEFPILSENNGGTPDPAGGAYVNVHGYDTRLFLGAFRYVEWTPTPPPTPTETRRSHFKWILYARKLRNR